MNSSFMAGKAVRDITPELPQLPDALSLLGMPRKSPTQGVLNPLRAEVLALSDGNESLLIVTCDQVFIRESLTGPVRQRVADILGQSGQNIYFGATHCHSAEFVYPTNPAAETTAWLAHRRQELEDALVAACVDARRNMIPAEIASASVELKEPVGIGRRMLMSNGSCINHWTAGSLAIPGVKSMGIEVETPMQVDVISVRSAESAKPFAILTSYPSHIQLIPLPYIDSEVAGAAKREVEKRHPGTIMLYANGTAGDTTACPAAPPPSSGNPDDEKIWYEKQLSLLGGRFANAVDEALKNMVYRRPEKIHLATFRDDKALDTMYSHQPQAGILIQAAAFGDAAILNVQGELFSRFGLHFHADSPFRTLLTVGYNEFGYSYLGTCLAYEQGSYEIKGTLPRNPDEEAAFRKQGISVISPSHLVVGRMIEEKTHALLHELAARR